MPANACARSPVTADLLCGSVSTILLPSSATLLGTNPSQEAVMIKPTRRLSLPSDPNAGALTRPRQQRHPCSHIEAYGLRVTCVSKRKPGVLFGRGPGQFRVVIDQILTGTGVQLRVKA